jgi:hypothetical protein
MSREHVRRATSILVADGPQPDGSIRAAARCAGYAAHAAGHGDARAAEQFDGEWAMCVPL